MHEIIAQKDVLTPSVTQLTTIIVSFSCCGKRIIGESSLAIAYYVTAYVTKAERSNMQDLCQEVSSHASVYSKLWSFGVRSLRSRECGLYEASDLLLGDHLCGKSVTIKWIDVSQPHNRKRRLMNHSRLVEMRESNPNSTAIFEDNVIDTFYPDQTTWRMCVCMTLLPTMPSVA